MLDKEAAAKKAALEKAVAGKVNAERAAVEKAQDEAAKKAAEEKEKADAAKAAMDKAVAEKTQAELAKIMDEQRQKEAAIKAATDKANAAAAALEAARDKAEADRVKAEADKKAEEQRKKEAQTIQGHLEKRGEFKTLLSLFQAAGIVTLKSPGNYTIFAPTDAAFAKFSAIKIDDLKKPENIDMLKSLLSYHMLNGNFLLKNVTGQKAAPNALQGDVLNIDATGNVVKVGKAKITDTDTGAVNGTIYLVDEVLVPPSLPPPAAKE